MTRRSAFKGVSVVRDRHGRLRFRLRARINGRRIDCYLPGPYGSTAFIAAYEAAPEGGSAPSRRAKTGTVGQLVETYLESAAFANLADSTKAEKRLRLDWVKRVIGDARYARVRPRHMESLMAKKGGAHAANRLKKDMSQLFGVAAKNFGFTGPNPAALADSYKTNADGFHSWTDSEIAAYRERHESGTMARLALEIFLGTGAARQDAAALTRSNIRGGVIHYRRGKTGQAVTVPIVDELARELSLVPADRLVLLVNGYGKPMNSRGLGRAFSAWCAEAGLPENCRAHGLRKAGARRLAEAGATEHQIMAFLGHANPAMAARYTAAADRGTMAAAGLAKLRTVAGTGLSNLDSRLDKEGT